MSEKKKRTALDLLDAIGDVDNAFIAEAEKQEAVKKRRLWRKKSTWIAAGSAAACLVLALTLPVLTGWLTSGDKEEIMSGNAVWEDATLDIGWIEREPQDIGIYYLSGGEIVRKTVHMCDTPGERFDAWKEANGIGGDVPFVKVYIWNNGKSGESGGMAWYEAADTFIYQLTVSGALRNYYGGNGDALLESLEKTMTEDDDMDYDGFALYLQNDAGESALEMHSGKTPED